MPRPRLTSPDNRNTIVRVLGQYGFVFEHTGGGCTALIREGAGGVKTWITDGDASVPCFWSQEVWLWEGTDEEGDAGNGTETLGYTLAQVLAALDHPNESVTSLGLRLSMGFHKARTEDLIAYM